VAVEIQRDKNVCMLHLIRLVCKSEKETADGEGGNGLPGND
jgi:hypothetical protein